MKKQTLFFCLFLAIGVFAQDNSKLFRKSIDMDKAREVKTDIYFFAGELDINTSTEKLAECYYGYKDKYLKPAMTYNESGKTGYLSIKSEEEDRGINNDGNKWNLCLNKNVKNDLVIKLKAGEANINLEGSNLNSFDYRMTAGETKINLRNTSVPQVNFNLLAGESVINLSGKWHNDGVADIKGGVGEITVIVPYDAGVKVNVSGVLGEINIPFFNKNGRVYTNDIFDKATHKLFINISGAIGQINVRMEK